MQEQPACRGWQSSPHAGAGWHSAAAAASPLQVTWSAPCRHSPAPTGTYLHRAKGDPPGRAAILPCNVPAAAADAAAHINHLRREWDGCQMWLRSKAVCGAQAVHVRSACRMLESEVGAWNTAAPGWRLPPPPTAASLQSCLSASGMAQCDWHKQPAEQGSNIDAVQQP